MLGCRIFNDRELTLRSNYSGVRRGDTTTKQQQVPGAAVPVKRARLPDTRNAELPAGLHRTSPHGHVVRGTKTGNFLPDSTALHHTDTWCAERKQVASGASPAAWAETGTDRGEEGGLHCTSSHRHLGVVHILCNRFFGIFYPLRYQSE